MTGLIIFGGLVLLLLVWGIAHYNRFVRLRNHIRESWSDIDVELKRRYELIPNLVATVKGYAKHERDVLESLMELRGRALASTGEAESQARDESAMLLGLKSVFALAEGYPDLKADRNFLALQDELALTEDRIAASRRFYNANVRDMNQLCEMFPSSVIANLFGFERASYFELASDAERVVPKISV
ncbi:MAG: LemA family protein [Planctomycetota bacterium]|jgi:LemA protein